MTRFSGGRWASCLRFGLIAVCMAWSAECLAKSTGVDEDNALQSGPCYQALVDRNVSQPTTAPNRELGSACASENGDVEKAWARVVRLWGSDSADVPDYDNYRRADDSGLPRPAWNGLAFFGMILVYALCGTPMRSAVAMMSGGRGGGLRRTSEVLASLGLRGLFGLVLFWLFGFSYLTLAGSLVFVVIVVRKLRLPIAAAPAGREDATRRANGFAILAADAINDILGAAPGLVGLALLAQHDARLLAVAVGLSVVASVPAVVFARRRLRAGPVTMTIAGALLSAAVVALAQLDPPMAALMGGRSALYVLAPLALALAVLGSGWRASAARAPSSSGA